ncbi:MAG: tRNA-dihydrouridine synthase family protein [archaeon]|nr:tRNA-dihydrouridine synthase family protein [archaeon]
MALEFCGIRVKSPFFLAPMAAVTALPFRLMCKDLGAGLTITEQISATQIARNPDPFTNNEFFTIKTVAQEKPVGVQLFGVDEGDFIEAVQIVQKDFELINLNCGCPAHRETSVGAGAALLKNPEKIASHIEAIKTVTNKPVTAKIRLGWNHDESVRIAKIIERSGCDAIMVHGRTAEQKYMGKANWNAIRGVVDAVGIEVVANGDVTSGESAEALLKETGAKFAMVGREAMKNPFIFTEIKKFFDEGVSWEPSNAEKINAFFEYYDYCEKFNMVKLADLKLKAIHFTRGIEFTKQARVNILNAGSFEEIKNCLQEFEKIVA